MRKRDKILHNIEKEFGGSGEESEEFEIGTKQKDINLRVILSGFNNREDEQLEEIVIKL